MKLVMGTVAILVSMLMIQLSVSQASGEEKKSLVENFSKQWVVNEIVSFKPLSGHHFSDEAPQKCGEFVPSEKTVRQISCQIHEPGNHKITLNVCDNAKTFCKTETHQVTVTAPRGYDAKNVQKGVRYVHFIPKGERPPPKGFILNRPKRAIDRAKQRKQLLFINFFGHWCPPCNLYDELVFSDPDFYKESKDIVKVKMDADSDLSWEWKEHFHVGGYPTTVVADTELREIGRLVGYQNKESVLKWIDRMQSLRDEPIETVIASLRQGKVKEGKALEDAEFRVAEYYFNRAEYDNAFQFLNKEVKSKSDRLSYLKAHTHLKRETQKGDDKKTLAALVPLIDGFDSRVELGGWLITALEIDKDFAKEDDDINLEEKIKSFEKWAKSESLYETGYTAGDVYYQLAKIQDLRGKGKAAKEAFLNCAEAWGDLAKGSKLKVARGGNLEKAYCLLRAGKAEESEKLYRTMAQAYKGEFAFNYYFARALSELGKSKEALSYAERAVMNSYGDNWLRAVTLKAKIQLKMGEKSKAEKTVEAALKEAVLPTSTQIRSHRYLTSLRNVLKEEN